MKGRFGRFGGQYAPETVMSAVLKLEEEYEKAIADPEFYGEI